MGQMHGTLQLRPTRIGFLVHPNDKAILRRIIRLNTCLWGGIYNPIIPVSRSQPLAWRKKNPFSVSGKQLADGYIDFFQPDVFVESKPGLAQSCGIEDDSRHPFEKRVVTLDKFVWTEDGQRTEFAFGLNVFDLYRKLYKEVFRFKPTHDRKIVLANPENNCSLFVEAILGAFPDDEPLEYIKNGFFEGFDPTIIEPTSDEWISKLQGFSQAPLDFTRYNLEQRFGRVKDPRIFIVNPNSPLDVIDLWNLRLFHDDVLPIDATQLDSLQDFLSNEIKENHRPLPGNPNGVMIRTTIEIGRSLDFDSTEPKLRKLLSGSKQGSWGIKQWYDQIWERGNSDFIANPKPLTVEADTSDVEFTVDEKSKASIYFRTLSPDFSGRFGSRPARWVNVLELKDYSSNNRYALTIPSTNKVLRYPKMRLGESLLVSREGFVFPLQYKDHRENLELMTGREAVMDWLKENSIESSPSDPGAISDQMLISLKGLRGAHLLADKGTLLLLDKMAKSVRDYKDGKREEYRDRTASAGEWEEVLKKRKKNDFFHNIGIARFVESGALKLGLEVLCNNCDYKNWYSITGLSEQVTCERCLKPFEFPQASIDLKNSPWRWRVSGPFAVPDFANGAYATVLALRCFAFRLGYGDRSISYSTNLNLNIHGKQLEIDFAGWYRREGFLGDREEPSFFVGEAKSFAENAITEKEMLNLKSVATAIPGTILVVAVLKEKFSSSEIRLLKKLAQWGRIKLPDGRQRAPLIVLTGLSF